MAGVKWKRMPGGGLYTINPNGDEITIMRSSDDKRYWRSGDRYSESLKELKDTITQEIEDGGSGFRYGGAVKKMKNGGCVMKGRGGSFKGIM